MIFIHLIKHFVNKIPQNVVFVSLKRKKSGSDTDSEGEVPSFEDIQIQEPS